MHYNFISFPVSYSHFSDVKKRFSATKKPLSISKQKILKATIELYKSRNFSQVELNHPYIQIESCLFMRFFISLRNQNAQSIEKHLRIQLALLFLMESLFVQNNYKDIKNSLVEIKRFFNTLASKALSNEPLSFTKIKIFSETDINIFSSILNNKIEKNIFRFKIYRNWNKDEFPEQYQPLITEVAELISNIAIFQHKDDFDTLFNDQSCFNTNPFTWFKEKVITESAFLKTEVSITKKPNYIEMEETSRLLHT